MNNNKEMQATYDTIQAVAFSKLIKSLSKEKYTLCRCIFSSIHLVNDNEIHMAVSSAGLCVRMMRYTR